jgi:hypothetical protein
MEFVCLFFGGGDTHRQQGDLISLLQNQQSRLEIIPPVETLEPITTMNIYIHSPKVVKHITSRYENI